MSHLPRRCPSALDAVAAALARLKNRQTGDIVVVAPEECLLLPVAVVVNDAERRDRVPVVVGEEG